MANLYGILKLVMGVADALGEVDSLDMGDWGNKMERIAVHGVTFEGQPYDLTLFVDKEEKNGN